MTKLSYLSAYRKVLRVCSQQFIPGEIMAICKHHYQKHIRLRTEAGIYSAVISRLSRQTQNSVLTMHVREFSPMKESRRT